MIAKMCYVTWSNTLEHIAMSALSTTSLRLDPETKERVQRLASARRRSAHWLMREAIEQYVEREEKREQFRQDALAAWDEYQETGLHVTAEEADAWLAKLEAGEDADAPECHG
jgi:predicted transcriptional regulator